jgi:DHA2 family multidrug resistance protein
MATSLDALIVCRVLQGLAGGGLQPSSQGVLLDAFPREQQGTAQTLFGMAALLAPVVGPTLGGFITDNYGWRWIFYLNVPVGLLALVLCRAVVVDPPYLQAEQARMRHQHQRFDTLGLCLLSVTMVSWEVVLSKGQEWDWLGDPFWRVQTLLFLLCLGGLLYHELRIANPLINVRTLVDRNFRACCLIIFCAYGVLYANTTTLPGLLQSLFGYDTTTSVLVLSPAGVFALAVLFVVGLLLTRGVDARYLIAVGLLTLALGNYWLALGNLNIGPRDVVWQRVVVIAGLSMVFSPLNVAAFLSIPRRCAGPPWGCSPSCATRAAAWARRWHKPCSNGASSFTCCGSPSGSTRSTQPCTSSWSTARRSSCNTPVTRRCRGRSRCRPWTTCGISRR